MSELVVAGPRSARRGGYLKAIRTSVKQQRSEVKANPERSESAV